MNTEARRTTRSTLYEKLLLFYPPAYLRAHRDELLQNFDDLERDLGRSAAFWMFIVGDLFISLTQQYMHYLRTHRWAQLALVVITILAVLSIWQFVTLRIAHSSFDNYAAFRGCETITSRTDTSGTCTLSNGRSISIVQYQGKWYLQGDLPPLCFGKLCL